MAAYIPLGPEPEDARPWAGPEPEDAVPRQARAAQNADPAEKASPETVPGLAYAAGRPVRPPSAGRLNRYALLSALLAVFCPPVSIGLGAVGLYQTRRSSDRGRGMAVFGLSAGVLLTFVYGLFILLMIALMNEHFQPG